VLFKRFQSGLSSAQNKALVKAYLTQKDASDVIKTHYIKGRFENIYLQREKLPCLTGLLDEGVKRASQVLENTQALKVGFWFNEMQAGDSTSLHNHDEDDELLSGVYYLSVPHNSGKLVLGDTSKSTENCLKVMPREGEFIFFSPRLLHEVEENKSSQVRLSIGMNFGPAD
jgi:hypothetical protein